MRRRVAIVIAAVGAVAVVAYFLRSAPRDTAEERAETISTPANASKQPQRQGHNARTGAVDAGTSHAASLRPTDGRQHDVCTELAERRMAREQAARDAEPKDPTWAYSMEQKLREYTSRGFRASEIQVTAIDCKTTLCEITAQGFAAETSEEFNKVMSAVREEPWNDFTGLSVTHDTDSGKGLHYARVSRRQSNQPARAELDDMQRAVLLSEEQALAACTAQVIERQDRERAARDAQPRDSTWAEPMEQLLRQHIETQLRKHPVERLEIACRATFCIIKASGQKNESQLAFQKVAQQVGSEPWANLRNGEGGGSGYGDTWKQEYTLYRDL